ncbi:MAG: hypothetical protein NTX76_03070 [Alphaproteobacteria bacterium]|nr:hypothetical protein [Alphaproteobacteria bacterium]
MVGINSILAPSRQLVTGQAPAVANPFAANQGKSFQDFMGDQITSFTQHAHAVEKEVNSAARGGTEIENIIPMVAEFSLEFEAQTKIVEALKGVIQALQGIQI